MTLWLVMVAKRFDSMTLSTMPPFPVRLTQPTDPAEPTHFLPVFETREAAEAWAGGKAAVVEIVSAIAVEGEPS